MKKYDVKQVAGVLRVLVTITFVCNLLALIMVPGMAMMRDGRELVDGVVYFRLNGENVGQILLRLAGFAIAAWSEIWMFGTNYAQVLAIFLFFCGCCTAVILWQARRVLDTILAGAPFSFANAANMTRAAGCCLLISLAALARLIWGFTTYHSIRPLLTYNALFVPVFAMGFLLCMVMSALFRQAAELKAENDLTI